MNSADFVPALSIDYDRIREYIRTKMINHQPKRLTTADLAAKTGFARGTIDNFFDGTTKRPQFDLICNLLWAVDGSADESLGWSSPAASAQAPGPSAPAPSPVTEALVRQVSKDMIDHLELSHAQTIASKNDTIQELRDEASRLRTQNTSLTRWNRFFICENVLLACVLLVDALVPTVGWIRSLLPNYVDSGIRGSFRG